MNSGTKPTVISHEAKNDKNVNLLIMHCVVMCGSMRFVTYCSWEVVRSGSWISHVIGDLDILCHDPSSSWFLVCAKHVEKS